jgi:hypothetical protein
MAARNAFSVSGWLLAVVALFQVALLGYVWVITYQPAVLQGVSVTVPDHDYGEDPDVTLARTPHGDGVHATWTTAFEDAETGLRIDGCSASGGDEPDFYGGGRSKVTFPLYAGTEGCLLPRGEYQTVSCWRPVAPARLATQCETSNVFRVQ